MISIIKSNFIMRMNKTNIRLLELIGLYTIIGIYLFMDRVYLERMHANITDIFLSIYNGKVYSNSVNAVSWFIRCAVILFIINNRKSDIKEFKLMQINRCRTKGVFYFCDIISIIVIVAIYVIFNYLIIRIAAFLMSMNNNNWSDFSKEYFIYFSKSNLSPNEVLIYMMTIMFTGLLAMIGVFLFLNSMIKNKVKSFFLFFMLGIIFYVIYGLGHIHRIFSFMNYPSLSGLDLNRNCLLYENFRNLGIFIVSSFLALISIRKDYI